ncbi:MAG: Cof-type HAD-IIB family hydrolase [Reyranellaceae bacterium]
MSLPRPPPVRLSAVVSDVDGTLVTDDKRLTDRVRAAVARIRAAGLPFCLISSRPPRGLAPVMHALEVDTPTACFNGGVVVGPDLAPLEEHLLTPAASRRAIEFLEARGLGVWLFSDGQWMLRNPAGPYVDHEHRTVGFAPVVVAGFDGALEKAAKIVGVSADFDRLARCEAELAAMMGNSASVVRSQRYYLDTTAPAANKGAGLQALARRLGVPAREIAVVGDGANDVAMFAESGLAIAMGNALQAVQARADHVSASNGADGFADAVERFILAARP